MAVLSLAERQAVWARFMEDASRLRDPLPLTKPDLLAAVNAVDDWVEANTAGYNAAIPLPARTALTAKQKAWLLFVVVRRRFEVS